MSHCCVIELLEQPFEPLEALAAWQRQRDFVVDRAGSHCFHAAEQLVSRTGLDHEALDQVASTLPTHR